MATGTHTNIDAYIADFPPETQRVLQQLRNTIKDAAPGAHQKISYAIPTFTLDGQALMYFAGYKNHVSVYPAPRDAEEFKEELSAYKGGKGTVQFPLAKKIPFDLVSRMVEYRANKIKVNKR